MAIEMQCPDDVMQRVLAAARENGELAADMIGRLCSEYPQDARLPFLQGSILAGLQRYDEALTAMAIAVEIQPEFILARFQFGFLMLTCARATEAQEIWTPLLALPVGNPFRLFAQGLGHLIRDEFAAAIDRLEAGITANTENPLVNNDMQLIIDEIRARPISEAEAAQSDAANDPSAQPESALLFGRYAMHDPSAYKH